MQAGGRLVEDVERVAGARLGKLARELDPLSLTTGELRGRLAEPHVAQPDIDERIEDASDLRCGGEEGGRIRRAHLQNVGNRLPMPGGRQRF